MGLTSGVGVESDLKDLRDARYFLREIMQAEQADLRCADGNEVRLETRPAQLVSAMAQLRIEAEELVIAHFSDVQMVAQLLVAKKCLTQLDVVQALGVVAPRK